MKSDERLGYDLRVNGTSPFPILPVSFQKRSIGIYDPLFERNLKKSILYLHFCFIFKFSGSRALQNS